jgi:hypothetical protein
MWSEGPCVKRGPGSRGSTYEDSLPPTVTITGETGYLKAAVFCNGWSYSLVDIGRRFGGAYCVHHEDMCKARSKMLS